MKTWDVVVLGAGPAGAVAARSLARQGRAVLLIDKSEFPRAKVCGGCLNRAAQASLDAIGLGSLAKDCGAARVDRARIASAGRHADVPLPGTVSLSREAFDAALVAAAATAGVMVRTGVRATLGPASGVKHTVHLNSSPSEEVEARVVIDSTGLAGADGPITDGSRLGVGAVLPAAGAPSFYEPGTVYLAVAPSGYVGLVRVENDRLDVAAAIDPSFLRSCGGPESAVNAVLERTGWPTMIGTESWKGTPLLTRRPSARAGHRLFRIGDAAGYIEPFTGEGMAWAINSAIAVAPIVSLAVDGWDDSLIRKWTRSHNRLIGRRQKTCRVVVRVLRSPTLTGLAIWALSFAPRLSRPVVAALNRPFVVARRSFP